LLLTEVPSVAERSIRIAMNGVTGRMGRNQHLERSIMAIRRQGGVELPNGDRVVPEPVLVGRNPEKLEALAAEFGVDEWTTDLDGVLADPDIDVYFDAQLTSLRAAAVRAAIDAGKAVYCEKPLAEDSATARDLARRAQEAAIAHGIVQDKLFLPGLLSLRRLIDSGFFGRILAVKGDFGYWVFEGDVESPQRPAWNYKREEGGGIILDMFPHWQYVIEGLFGRIRSVVALGKTHIPTRWDGGEPYEATADDAAYAIMELEDGTVVQMNSSWATRVYRDELLVFQVDGTHGSAVAGLRGCRQQHRSATPRPVWNPDIPNPIDFRAGWLEVPQVGEAKNAFQLQWEEFIRHVTAGTPFAWDFSAGVRGLELVDAAWRSWQERRWVDLSEVSA
jgi:predicted dehydrogenase